MWETKHKSFHEQNKESNRVPDKWERRENHIFNFVNMDVSYHLNEFFYSNTDDLEFMSLNIISALREIKLILLCFKNCLHSELSLFVFFFTLKNSLFVDVRGRGFWEWEVIIYDFRSLDGCGRELRIVDGIFEYFKVRFSETGAYF